MSILDEAKKVVYERNAAYGQPEDNFAQTAQMWSAYLGVEITPQDVGLMMILLKVAREKYQHKHDNLVDIAGYAECVSRLEEKRADTEQVVTGQIDMPRCAKCGREILGAMVEFNDSSTFCIRCAWNKEDER